MLAVIISYVDLCWDKIAGGCQNRRHKYILTVSTSTFLIVTQHLIQGRGLIYSAVLVHTSFIIANSKWHHHHQKLRTIAAQASGHLLAAASETAKKQINKVRARL